MQNIQNIFVKKIHLFVDDDNALKVLNNINNSKIVVVKVGIHAKHSDYFVYASNNLTNEVCMVANSDIIINKMDEKLLNKVNLNKICYALTRYEHDMSCPLILQYSGSHDAYIFKSSKLSNNIELINYYPNMIGIETRIIKYMIESGYQVYNPCKQIIIMHIHKSEVRNYAGDWIGLHKYGDYNFYKSEWCIQPCTIDI